MSKESAMALMNGTPAPVEVVAPAAPVTEVAPTKEVDSDRFARLAAKEARLVKEREGFKTEQQRLLDERKGLEEVQAKIKHFEELKKTDPVQALKDIGFTEDDMFNFLSGKVKEELTPEQKAEAAAQAAIKKFEDAQEAKAKKEQEDAYDQSIKSFKGEIKSAIAKETETYEFLNYQGALGEELVYETILEIYKIDKEILPHEAMKEALELAESFYEEEAKKMMMLKKLAPKVEATPAKVEEPKAPVKPSIAPSLTNKVTTTIASTVPRPETRAEKRARLEEQLRAGFKRT